MSRFRRHAEQIGQAVVALASWRDDDRPRSQSDRDFMEAGETVADFLDAARRRNLSLIDVEDVICRAHPTMPLPIARGYAREWAYGFADHDESGLAQGVIMVRRARPQTVAKARRYFGT